MPPVRALVTGATGRVGHSIARALIERGDQVRALVREPGRAASVLPPGVEAVRGDVTDPATVERAAAGCELVFNAMGLPEQWFADPEVFERVNARGTDTVVRAAAQAGARRVVHTSTIDVFHAERGSEFDESQVGPFKMQATIGAFRQSHSRPVFLTPVRDCLLYTSPSPRDRS